MLEQKLNAVDRYKIDDVVELTSKMLKMSHSDYTVYTNQRERTTLERMLTSVIDRAIDQADTRALDAVLNRAFGRPRESVEITQKDAKNHLLSITPTSAVEAAQIYQSIMRG
jgi:hypothetical protein